MGGLQVYWSSQTRESVNEVICHGIPDTRKLEDGDIVNVDITVYYKGYHGDLNETFYVGKVDERYKKLVRVAWECLDLAIKEENKAIGIMKPGHSFTIEPMINEGVWRDEMWPDKWTAVTEDGKRSAQFEHTLLVTETGCEILTRRREKNAQPHFMDSENNAE
ncbi:MAP1-like protein [Mya arenaria]|uniref:MAP1-like protein n=1 Tax=Mya arenaria TaxID=6604 RepID=A0ABY7DF91_MYAAR|nr:MAP1-like protein [Mya arenaria]